LSTLAARTIAARRVRLRVWRRRTPLDRRLATGTDPDGSPELALRAAQLCEPGTRRAVAAMLTNILDAADEPASPAEHEAPGRAVNRAAIAQARADLIPPALEEAKRHRSAAGLPAIRDEVTPHTLRYTCIASLFAAGADQEYVADQVGHEDVTTTNRIYRYVLQRRRRGGTRRSASRRGLRASAARGACRGGRARR